MYNQQITNAVMRAARGGTELRRGGTVMLRLANGACGLCRSAELSDGDDITRLSRPGSALLILTAPRLLSLDGFCRITIQWQVWRCRTSATMPFLILLSDKMTS